VVFSRFKLPIYPGILRLMLVLMLMTACASVPPSETVRPDDPEGGTFAHAEAFWGKGAMDQALAYYTHYLGQFPQGRYAATARLRIGTIYQQQGLPEAAQAFYRSAIEQFPNSAAAVESRSALLDLLIAEDRLDEAADIAAALLDGPADRKMKQSVLHRLSRLHRQTDKAALSVWYAYLMYKELPYSDKYLLEADIKESISRLQADDIEILWDRLEDRTFRGHLMYRYAVVQAEQGHYDAALELLTTFHHSFPDHPFTSEALQRIETLTTKLSFEPHTLGCLLPLSGSHEAFGRRVLNAVELALSLMRAGESPPRIKLVVEDSGSDDETTIKAVHKLAAARVGAILGPINTAPAAALEAQKLNIPIFAFTQKADITAIGDFVFRNFITPRSQVRTLVDYYINVLGMHKFAVIYPAEIYGQTFTNLFWDEVIRQGGRMVAVEGYAPGRTDFAETIKKLTGNHYAVPSDLRARPLVHIEQQPYYSTSADAPDRLETWVPDAVSRLSGLYYQNPNQERSRPSAGSRSEESREPVAVGFDVLFIPDAPRTAGLILPQLAYHDIANIQVAGTNLWHSRQLIDMAQQFVQDAVLVDGYYKDSASPIVRRFVETYRSVYDTEPELMEAFAFDTANMLFALLDRPDIRMRHELRDQLKQMVQPDGVTGATSFGPDGDAIKKLSLLRIKGDRFLEIQP
jgi:branched-chain amino acid transport system substrate-binding protein